MNKEDVIHGLKTLAKQERKAQSLLTGPREAPQEFERWYIAEVLESAVLIIEQRDRLAEAIRKHRDELELTSGDSVDRILWNTLVVVKGGNNE
jgi:hypothetical protein